MTTSTGGDEGQNQAGGPALLREGEARTHRAEAHRQQQGQRLGHEILHLAGDAQLHSHAVGQQKPGNSRQNQRQHHDGDADELDLLSLMPSHP